MDKKSVETTKAPAAAGPYSQAIISGGFIFCSGQIGIDPESKELTSGIKNQTNQVFANLKEVLQSASASFTDVVKVNVYLKDMDDYAVMNDIYAKHFPKPYPTRATIEVAKLPKGALVEIELIAYQRLPSFAKASEGERGCCGGSGDCQCAK